MIQRNAWKVIQRLVENRQTRVFATFEQGQPTKFVEQSTKFVVLSVHILSVPVESDGYTRLVCPVMF